MSSNGKFKKKKKIIKKNKIQMIYLKKNARNMATRLSKKFK